jgi:hypothetical protein
MEPAYLSYLSILTSLIALGVSIYTIFVVLPKKERPTPKTEKVTPSPQVPVVATRVLREKAPSVKTTIRETVVELKSVPPPTTVPLVPQIPQSFVSTPTFSKNTEIGPVNSWYLEVTGIDGNGFDIHVEWSDGSHDIMGGIIPVELEFSRSHGITPVKIQGIPPRKNNGAQFLWELNGFHWS